MILTPVNSQILHEFLQDHSDLPLRYGFFGEMLTTVKLQIIASWKSVTFITCNLIQTQSPFWGFVWVEIIIIQYFYSHTKKQHYLGSALETKKSQSTVPLPVLSMP